MADRPTIQDIARLAGVSKATVSRVLNQKPDVDPATRERVLRIVAEQGFIPSATATGLAGRSRMLGVLVPSLTWTFIPEIMRGVADVIEGSNYELVLYSLSHPKDRAALLDRILATRLTSGLLAVLPGPAAEHIAALSAQGYPVVLLDDQTEPKLARWVGVDNVSGGYLATRHLLDLGHRRIGYVQGPLHYLCARERYAGYCQALREFGVDSDPALLWQGDFEIPSGHACGRAIAALPGEQRPTAVFVSNDQMAHGLLAAAEECGMRVPDDLAVIGFDDVPPTIHTRVALTTVRQPFFEMGQRATRMLLDLVNAPRHLAEGAPPAAGERLQLPTSIIIRESCGARQRGAVPVPTV
jgi:LacI family transcriptional regulator